MTTNATNTTPHYRLSQWEGEDSILREDFNSDNAIIDATLHAHEQAMVTVKLGEFRVPEEGGTASRFSFDLSGVDLSQYTKLVLTGALPPAPDTYTYGLRLQINGDDTLEDYTRSTMTYVGAGQVETTGGHWQNSFILVGRSFNVDGGDFVEVTLCDGWSHLIALPTTLHANAFDTKGGGDADSGVLEEPTFNYEWKNGRLQDIQTLEIRFRNESSKTDVPLPAGMRLVLSGQKY